MPASPPNPFRESKLNTSDDYRADWDVLDLNARLTDWLADEMKLLIGRKEPDPGQKIAVMTGSPGYGKTHLFGRVEHQIGADVFFAFVPSFEPATEPIDHVRVHVVEALFARKGAGGRRPIEDALAALCRPAMADYFRDLPPPIAARHGAITRQLADSADAVLSVVDRVRSLDPFLKLADSLLGVLACPGQISRAFALGWAPEPWSDLARRWLRGEDLSDANRKAVGLSDEPPTAMDVLRAVPELFGHARPMLICCDQIEGVLQGENADRINAFSNTLMEILNKVPCQVVLSCYEDQWDLLRKNAFAAFTTRIKPWQMKSKLRLDLPLDPLRGDHAAKLVAARLAGWPGKPEGAPATWPFREESLRAFVDLKAPTPRGVIKDYCEPRFQAWLDDGRADWIAADDDSISPPPPPDFAFLREWNREVEAVKADRQRSPAYLAEDRMYRGVLEALKLAQAARMIRDFGGVRVSDVSDHAVKSTAASRKPSSWVSLSTGPGQPARRVIVALSKIEASQKFSAYFKAMFKAIDENQGSGLLLVHPSSLLSLGATTEANLMARQEKHQFRLLALEEHPTLHQSLETLVALLDRADARELVVGGVTLSAEDCREYVIKAGLVDNLDLFKMLAYWNQPAPQPKANAEATDQPRAQPEPQPEPEPETQPQPEPQPEPEPEVDEGRARDAAKAEEYLARAVRKLKGYNLVVLPKGFEVGPTFVRLKVDPVGKTSFAAVSGKAQDLKIAIGCHSVPIVGSQAGFISIDVQRPEPSRVTLASALLDPPKGKDDAPTFPVGVDVAGNARWLDLSRPSDCHLLVAGTTGSGKSTFLMAMVAALATRLGPDQVQFLLIDPKRLTFNIAGKSPYLRHPVAHSVEEALPVFEATLAEMHRRYKILEERKLTDVADLPPDLLPRTILIVDEFASFLETKASKKAAEELLKPIGAMARAAGIHLVVSTQRPDKDVVTPILRENLPGRIALKVSSRAGSDLILGSGDAEHLIGNGDLFWKAGGELLRLQSPMVTQAEFEKILRVSKP